MPTTKPSHTVITKAFSRAAKDLAWEFISYAEQDRIKELTNNEYQIEEAIVEVQRLRHNSIQIIKDSAFWKSRLDK